MEIRVATEKDAKAIKAFFEELREYELGLFDREMRYMQENWERKRDLAAVRKLLNSKGIVLVAEVGKTMVGFANGYVVKGVKCREGYIDTLYVEKQFRKGGVGKALTKELMDWFRKKGCKTISLSTYAINKKARGFYESLGFRLVGVRYRKKLVKE